MIISQEIGQFPNWETKLNRIVMCISMYIDRHIYIYINTHVFIYLKISIDMSMYIDMYISIYINTYISVSILVDILRSPNRWTLIVTVTYAFTSSCVPYTYLSYNFLLSVSNYLSCLIILHYISLLLRNPSPLQYF